MEASRARWLALVLLGVAGCDLPVPVSSDGPRVVSITPDLTAGPVDRQVTVRIALDRRVAPGSVAQGVVEITSGDNYVWVELDVDVIHPALVVTPLDPMDPDVDYRLVVHSLRDLEGHASADTMPIVFHTGLDAAPQPAAAVTYAEVAPTLETCVRCHGGETPAVGLDLSGPDAIRRTVLDVPARAVAPSVIGSQGAEVTASLIGLPRIDRGFPARSYLLYTMLGDEHVAGAPMPPDDALASDAELQRLEDWIETGAPLD